MNGLEEKVTSGEQLESIGTVQSRRGNGLKSRTVVRMQWGEVSAAAAIDSAVIRSLGEERRVKGRQLKTPRLAFQGKRDGGIWIPQGK